MSSDYEVIDKVKNIEIIVTSEIENKTNNTNNTNSDIIGTIKEPKSIVLLLLNVLSSEINIAKINFVLTDDITEVLYKLIYFSPNFLNEIDTLVNEIIKDNKIDSADIPNLILLIKKIYELICKLKDIKFDDAKKVEICSSILKFLIRFLIEERKVNIKSENKEIILELIDTLIDSCIGLIHLSSNLNKSSCFIYIKSLFGFK
jgi:hypothetical protein